MSLTMVSPPPTPLWLHKGQVSVSALGIDWPFAGGTNDIARTPDNT